MKIKTRLSLLFTLITATILLFFAFIIYYSAKENREKEFDIAIEKEAITKANLFFNTDIDAQTLQSIYRNNRQIINEVEVAIYDTEFNLLYHDAVDIDLVKETPEMINEIHQNGEMYFYQKDWQVVGLSYEFEDKTYIITATAYDKYGYNKLDTLYQTASVVFICSILIIFLVGRFFSTKAFKPVTEMTQRVKEISASHLDFRLTTDANKDEISELAQTFNAMLDRLENSFEAQKNFVSNISHELRTPLAALIAELELSLNKNRSQEELRSAVHYALSDARKLARLSNSLLDFAKASYDPSEITFKPIRIDEILLDAKLYIHQIQPNYKITIHFEGDIENDIDISISGNEYLLRTAFINLLENGCKFSKDNQSKVTIDFNASDDILLKFEDHGIGIAEEDLRHIFTPFYRGTNKTYADGNGIGLSLTQKIIQLHAGSITATSELSKGTLFKIQLKKIKA